MFLEDILHRFHRGTRGKRPAEAAMHSAVPPRSSCILKMSMLLFGPIHFFDRNTYIFYIYIYICTCIYIYIILYHYISIFSQIKGRKKSHPLRGVKLITTSRRPGSLRPRSFGAPFPPSPSLRSALRSGARTTSWRSWHVTVPKVAEKCVENCIEIS